MSDRGAKQPAIADYGLIGDCHGSALVSSQGSIDWCCVPRFDSGSCFGRLLDWERGGFCSIALDDDAPASGASAYREDTLVLESELEGSRCAARVVDFFAMRTRAWNDPRCEVVRILESSRGAAAAQFVIAPRFDYGAARPWLRQSGAGVFTAIGGDDGLYVWSDGDIAIEGESLVARARLHAGERLRLLLRFVPPHALDAVPAGDAPTADDVDARLHETAAWWRRWRRRVRTPGAGEDGVARSALTLKALTYEPTGAIVAAPTTSLPEAIGGDRNWDYRYSWIRDSALAARALSELGCETEAEESRHFIVRSSAGHAEDVQVLFGVGGERRAPEIELELSGYRASRPVRIGNSASAQLQLDALGELLNLGWRWHRRGRSPDDDEWRFFAELVDAAAERWGEPDCGIWEQRGERQHYVHSKAACWAAIDRGLKLAEECARRAPRRRWQGARDQVREAIEAHGYDAGRGVFVRSFGASALDAALLLLPVLGFVSFDDERMVRTADAVREDLGAAGFLRRYSEDDGLAGQEGAFVACSFWLAECYARQGRAGDARAVYERALAAASPLGLFAEQVDPDSGELLGNYPQALSHLSHIAAAIALAECDGARAHESPADASA